MRDYLKSGYAVLQKHQSNIVSASIDYGDWLNAAYALHFSQKASGKISSTWKEWLEKEIGIADSHARKLREIARMLSRFPGMRKVGISFNEIYYRRKHILNMLETDQTISTFWQTLD